MSTILSGTVLLSLLVLSLAALVLTARQWLLPMRRVLVTVNGGKTIASQTGERLLAALNDNGVLVPSACAGVGSCGLCKVKVTGTPLAPLPTESARLTRAELRDGMHLACQVVLRGDMAVEVDEALLGAESFETTVRSTRHLTPLIREIVLDLPPDLRPPIVAGSFVQVTAPPHRLDYAALEVPADFAQGWERLRGLKSASTEPVTRAYSISNRPEDIARGRLVLNVRLALPPPSVPGAPPGIVSSWLFGLKPGDRIDTAGPFGSVRVQDTGAEMVFIGGGVGMAPLRAMIFEQLETVRTKRQMRFFYGARSRAELIYHEEFDSLQARHPNFSWTPALSDPDPGDAWEGARGFVHQIAFERHLRGHPAPEACEYYLCGPPLMIRAVLAMLDDLGVSPDRIFNDDFGV